MVRKQKGGLKLIMKEGVDNSGFNPVFDMLQNPDSKISVLTYESLTGFMIEMNVSDDISRYLTNGNTSRFNKIVNNYIFKFAVLSETSSRIPNYKDVNKKALLNWLFKFGWSHPDPNFDSKHKTLSMDEMIALFNEGNISNRNCKIDKNKLLFLNKAWNKRESILL